MDAPPDLAPLPPGTRLHALVIRKTLGRGGVGIVYAAEHEILSETFAIKEFLPEQLARRVAGHRVAALPGKERIYEGLKRKFMEEGQTLVELARPRPHPNLVQVTDAFYENDTVYLCMRFERGRPLDEVLKEHGPLSETEARELLLPLLDGLAHAHAQGVWHRDIKPSNILIREDGSPVLIDFGAAHRERPNGAMSIIAQYTPSFAAPEQLYDGVQGPWTDVYSLAATLYYAATGQLPPSRLEPGWQDQWPGYSPVFLRAIEVGLSFDPDKRPKDATSWRGLFDSADHTLPLPGSLADADTERTQVVHPTPGRRIEPEQAATAPYQRSTPQRKQTAPPSAHTPAHPWHWARWSAAGAVVLSLVLGAGWMMLNQRHPSQPAVAPSPVQAPDIEVLSKRLNLADLDCARVELRLYGTQTLGLAGYLRDAGQLTALLNQLHALNPKLDIETRALAFAAPFCELISQIERLAPASDQYPSAPILSFNNPDRLYHEDQYLVLNVINPGILGGYLYLDFVDSHQQIVHLFPNPDQPDNFIAPGKQIRIGAQDADECTRTPDACFVVSRPHGNNLILALWSESPLLERWRSLPSEPAADYLAALETFFYGLAPHAPYRRAVSYYFFTTSE
ncbi:protein kinase [Caldichromatium japonicum]|uniref:Protein kinase n=1 Tax=Caldichromatium japonicum TaxID=2699430 RepID=A0A6G7VEU6_9GAMM|nr:serine/threonine-protein kinase [Caldichromatium japonicum]QIK38317.1 protein kinase [Caldichromatium japonicum]